MSRLFDHRVLLALAWAEVANAAAPDIASAVSPVGSKDSPLGAAMPAVLGFVIGFAGSVPIAGPCAAVVFKHGIQGEYAGGRAVAMGSSLLEATWAGVAYVSFGHLASKLDVIVPFSKVIGAVLLLLLGLVFMRYKGKDGAGGGKVGPVHSRKSSDPPGGAASSSSLKLDRHDSLALTAGGGDRGGGRRRVEVQQPPTPQQQQPAQPSTRFQGIPLMSASKLKDEGSGGKDSGHSAGFNRRKLLLGASLSALNPGLLATYGGALSAIVGSVPLEFTRARALCFAVGVVAGINTWFSILLRLLKRYQTAIKPQAVRKFVRAMGYVLFVLGLYVAHSAWVYFAAAPTSTVETTAGAAAAAAISGERQSGLGALAEAGAGARAGAMDSAELHDIAAVQREELRALSLNNHGVRPLIDVAQVESSENNIPVVSSSWGHEHHRDFQ